MDELNKDIDLHYNAGLTDTERAFLKDVDVQPEQYDTLMMLSAPDDTGGLRMAAVGFLGAMVTVYDDAGGTYQVDEPESWNQYLKSRWKDEWTMLLLARIVQMCVAALLHCRCELSVP